MPIALLFALALVGADLKQEDEDVEFKCEPGNYQVGYSSDWKRVKSPNPDIQLTLSNRSRALLVTGLESNVTNEEIIGLVKSDFFAGWDNVNVVSTKEIKFQGEKALRVKFEGKFTGLAMTGYLTVFSHQGIVYRVVGVGLKSEADALESDYDDLLKTFRFLAKREAWLTRNEGRPRRTSLAGGLVSVELNRPRWNESPQSVERDSFRPVQTAYWSFIQGGAWIHISAWRGQKSLERERNALRDELCARMERAKVKESMGKVDGMPAPVFDIVGTYDGLEHCYRMTIIERGGLFVQAYMEYLSGRTEETKKDWEQVLSSLRIRKEDPKEGLPIFRLESRPDVDQSEPDPNLAAFLGKATRLSIDNPFEVLALSSDGSRVLRRDGARLAIEQLGTHRSQTVLATAQYNCLVDWSKDGKCVAIATGEELIVASPASAEPRTLQVRAKQAVFLPQTDELLAVVRLGEADGNRFRPSYTRLERINVRTQERKRLIEFPLGRIDLPTPSPNGETIALVCNRDYPRRSFVGGHVYLCDRDGNNLRQLTKEPEDITGLLWAADGKSLYAVRRVKEGNNGLVGAGGSVDLYRINIVSGQATNLTRCNHIQRVWPVGNDLVLQLSNWKVPESQRGFFRIAPAELEKATAERPLPSTAHARVLAQKIAADIRKNFGNEAIDDIVPTPEILGRMAEAFAKACEQSTGARLDFSGASLERLRQLSVELNDSKLERTLIFGMGAYYGETLRKNLSAEWKLQPVPFSKWLPLSPSVEEGFVFANLVLPFSDVFRGGLDGERDPIISNLTYLKRGGKKTLLVYPPSYAAEAMHGAVPESYARALKRLDAGEVGQALDLMFAELRRNPKNGGLADEIFSIAQGSLDAEKTKTIIKDAVAEGCDLPQILLAHANNLAEADPEAALNCYRKAILADDWPSSDSLMKIGRLYQKLNRPELADCCFRRAYFSAAETQKAMILRLLNRADNP